MSVEDSERAHCLRVAEEWLGGGSDPHKFSRPSLAQLLRRERAAAVAGSDDPERDGTDAAHPAWWRGNDDGVAKACREVNRWLDGESLGGHYGAPELTALRERVLGLTERIEWLTRTEAATQAALKIMAAHRAKIFAEKERARAFARAWKERAKNWRAAATHGIRLTNECFDTDRRRFDAQLDTAHQVALRAMRWRDAWKKLAKQHRRDLMTERGA